MVAISIHPITQAVPTPKVLLARMGLPLPQQGVVVKSRVRMAVNPSRNQGPGLGVLVILWSRVVGWATRAGPHHRVLQVRVEVGNGWL